MAQEGLDIFSLNAEFLITPKTDIVQTVGRILRAKHKFSHPIIYDFVDTHDVFQRQWLKRKAYYKKQNYKIIGTNSYDYCSDTKKWKNIYEPKIESCITKKKISIKSISSLDNDSDIEDDDDDDEVIVKDKYLSGQCLLTFKK
jgi:superfamily II DNA or RNA helicase